jgi:hypothetical protein
MPFGLFVGVNKSLSVDNICWGSYAR